MARPRTVLSPATSRSRKPAAPAEVRPWIVAPGRAFRVRVLGHPVVATYHDTLTEVEARAADLGWEDVEVIIEWLNRSAYSPVCPADHVEHRAIMWATLGREPEPTPGHPLN